MARQDNVKLVWQIVSPGPSIQLILEPPMTFELID